MRHACTRSSSIRRLGLALLGAALLCDCSATLELTNVDSSQLDPDFGPRPDGIINAETMTCAEISRKAELPPLDMLLALDTSYSMDFHQKWPSVREALKAFAQDPKFSSLGLGLQYFPLRAQCKVEDYAKPAVPIGPLATSSADVVLSLDQQRMSGGTPMVPMLSGTVSYAREWATQNPDRKVVLVLATDGIPDNTCLTPAAGGLSNTLANVVQVAKDGAQGDPSIPTFVIGVGTELTSLNQISAAGGTGDAFLVDTSKNIQQAFLEALNDIRRTLACDYKIPPPPSSEVKIDYKAVNVRYTQGSVSETLVYVGSADHCLAAPDRGWYYDDPANPKLIILCEKTCRRAQAADNGQIDVLFGCKTIPA